MKKNKQKQHMDNDKTLILSCFYSLCIFIVHINIIHKEIISDNSSENNLVGNKTIVLNNQKKKNSTVPHVRHIDPHVA